jgi:non-ribosomal peptide synthetase component F
VERRPCGIVDAEFLATIQQPASIGQRVEVAVAKASAQFQYVDARLIAHGPREFNHPLRHEMPAAGNALAVWARSRGGMVIDQATQGPASLPASPVTPLLSWWLRNAAEREPGRIAIETAESSVTYAQLFDSVGKLSGEMRAAGIGPGDRVAIAANRSIHTITVILAAVEAGAAYVPLDMAFPGERLRAMLEDAQPRAVLGDEQALAALSEVVSGALPTLQSPAPQLRGVHADARRAWRWARCRCAI